MNAARRKALENIIDMINGQLMDLETIIEEERESYENLPESLQNSDRGEAMEENASDLDDIYNDLNDITDRLLEVVQR